MCIDKPTHGNRKSKPETKYISNSLVTNSCNTYFPFAVFSRQINLLNKPATPTVTFDVISF